MMKLKILALLIIIGFTAISIVQGAHGQSGGFVIERADATKDVATTASTPLDTLISQVGVRFVVERANGIHGYILAPFSDQLQTLLDGLLPRFIIEYANANQEYVVVYPKEMIHDSLPPVISNLSVNGGRFIRWETDEFATSELEFGMQPGNYTTVLQNSIYTKVHQYALSGLKSGITYYFKVRNTDRSGNTVQSAESTFILQSQVYIPLFVRP